MHIVIEFCTRIIHARTTREIKGGHGGREKTPRLTEDFFSDGIFVPDIFPERTCVRRERCFGATPPLFFDVAQREFANFADPLYHRYYLSEAQPELRNDVPAVIRFTCHSRYVRKLARVRLFCREKLMDARIWTGPKRKEFLVHAAPA